jgi:CitMHS family citrate-Mg2+:H+ or citrate-Ca2+:H+ symporter
MLTFIGVAIIFVVVGLLVLRKLAPTACLILVPFIGVLLAGFSLPQIGEFYGNGLKTVTQVAAMFIFAITFFGVMQDTGLFRPIVSALVSLSRGNVVAVAVCTAVVGMLAHLDGVGATTFLLTIPTLLPLYRRLKMNPYLMLMLLALGAGILNMMPWAGPLGRAAAVVNLDPVALWRPLIPLQLTGVVLLVLLAVLLGIREQRRLAASARGSASTAPEGSSAGIETDVQADVQADDMPTEVNESLLRPRLLWVNGVLFLGVLGALISGVLPSGYIFMIGLAVALMINYPRVDDQMARIAAHAPNALMMGSIILAAGTFLGILNGSGMLTSIAQDMVQILPGGAAPHLHLIIGFFGLPLDLLLSTDAYYFALLPIVVQIVSTYGVEPATAIYAMQIGNVIGTFISPFSPALWLALGLAGLEMGKHLRYSLVCMWIFSLVLLMAAVLMGLIPIA